MKTIIFVAVIVALAGVAFAEEEKKTEKRGLLGLGYGSASGYGYGGFGGYGGYGLDHGFGYSHGLGYRGYPGFGYAGYNGFAGDYGFGHGLAAPIHTGLPLAHAAPLPVAHGFYGGHGLHY